MRERRSQLGALFSFSFVRGIVRFAYSGLAGIVEAEEEQLSVLVCQPELGEHVPNYTMALSVSILLPGCRFHSLSALDMRQPAV